jgi:diguanylate cyclase (GGDEF)-like protein
VLERLQDFRNTILQKEFEYEGQQMKITFSAGIFHSDGAEIDSYRDILIKADNALYQSKKNGHNRITEVQGRALSEARSSASWE